MTVETVLLAALFTGALLLVRAHLPLIKSVWCEARWWEKAALVVALLPIPGPVDELVGVLVVRRVVRRRGPAEGRVV